MGDAQALRHEGAPTTRSWPPASSASTSRQRIVGDLLKAEIEREAGPFDPSTSSPSPSCRWPRISTTSTSNTTPSMRRLVNDLAGGGFCRRAAQCRAGRRHRHRQDAILPSPLPEALHPQRRPRPVLQRRRSRQSARDETRNGKQGRLADHLTRHGLHCPRRTRLSAVRPGRRATSVPPCQPALRAHLDHRHHQPRLR